MKLGSTNRKMGILKIRNTKLRDKTFIVWGNDQDSKRRYLKHTFCRPEDFRGDLNPSDLQDVHAEKCDDFSKFCLTKYLHASYLRLLQ